MSTVYNHVYVTCNLLSTAEGLCSVTWCTFVVCTNSRLVAYGSTNATKSPFLSSPSYTIDCFRVSGDFFQSAGKKRTFFPIPGTTQDSSPGTPKLIPSSSRVTFVAPPGTPRGQQQQQQQQPQQSAAVGLEPGRHLPKFELKGEMKGDSGELRKTDKVSLFL